MMTKPAVISLSNVGKRFGNVIALSNISIDVQAGQVMCLLGDNGAGKSTLIKVMSGVHRPSEGVIKVEGVPMLFSSPADAQRKGIATVFQDLAMIPLMSITRNFFMGREPERGGFAPIDWQHCHEIVKAEMDKIGIDVRDPTQAVGTLSGGERQCVAISRAMYFGAKVLILDEPTSALGVKQAAIVLRYIHQAKQEGLGVVFITHNVHHAYTIGDSFTILKRGTSMGTFRKKNITKDSLLQKMAGGVELENLERSLMTY